MIQLTQPMMQEIYHYGPIVATMVVYADLLNFTGDGVYQQNSSDAIGAHAVSISSILTKLQCTTASAGYYIAGTQIVTACAGQIGCGTNTANTCSTESSILTKLKCTTASAGYYVETM